MPLKASEFGKITHYLAPGTVISAGDLLASLELKDPSKVEKIEVFDVHRRVSANLGDSETNDLFLVRSYWVDATISAIVLLLLTVLSTSCRQPPVMRKRKNKGSKTRQTSLMNYLALFVFALLLCLGPAVGKVSIFFFDKTWLFYLLSNLIISPLGLEDQSGPRYIQHRRQHEESE